MAASTLYVTPAGAGTKSGADWANAMGLAEFETDFEGAAEPGDVYYLYSGTYTLTNDCGDVATKPGTKALPIWVIGCSDQNTPPTEATGAARPLIAVGSYSFGKGTYGIHKNLRLSGAGNQLCISWDKNTWINCDFENNTIGSSKFAGYGRYGSRFVDCVATCPNGYAFGSGYVHAHYYWCYAHDSTTGFEDPGAMFDCIADTCTTGVLMWRDEAHVVNCVFYNGTTGMTGGAGAGTFMNCVIESFTTGASWSSEQKSNLFDYNNWHGNTVDVSNVTKGASATAADPGFQDAPGGDFRPAPGSSCLDAGFGIRLGTGGSETTVNQGAVQNASGGGGIASNRGVLTGGRL